MEVKISTRQFKRMYKTVSAVFQKKAEHNDVALYATDGNLYMSAWNGPDAIFTTCAAGVAGDQQGYVTMDGLQLNRMLSAVESSTVELVTSSSTFLIRTPIITHYPIIAEPVDSHIRPIEAAMDTIYLDKIPASVVAQLKFICSAADDPARTTLALGYVHMFKSDTDKLIIEATDARRIHRVEAHGSLNAFNVLIKKSDMLSILSAAAGDALELHAVNPDNPKYGKHIVFKTPTAAFVVYNATYTKNYPNTSGVSTRPDSDHTHVVDAAELLLTLKYAKRIIDATPNVNKAGRAVILNIADNALMLSCAFASQWWGEAPSDTFTLALDSTDVNPSRKLLFKYDMDIILEAVKCFSGKITMQFDTSTTVLNQGILYLTNESAGVHTKAIVMPMRLN